MAIIGGSLNVWSNWDKIVKDPWSSLGYFGSGAAGTVTGLFSGPAAGFAVTSIGNVATDIEGGNFRILRIRQKL